VISIQYLFEQANLKLIPLDKKFHNTIDIENKDFDVSSRFDFPYSWWYTVLYNGKKAATVGIIIRGKQPDVKHFFQIAVHQEFRRKGLVKICADLMFEKFPKAKRLVAAIDKRNIASIGAHKKAGFKQIKSPADRPDIYWFEKRRSSQ
jgi:RimJ/RimL family protein N-acetyltransferase